MMLTEKYQQRISELAGIINEAGRIDFLKSKFKEWADGLYKQVVGMAKIRTFNPNTEHPDGGEWSEVEATFPDDISSAFAGKIPAKPKYDKKISEIFEAIIAADPLPNKQNAQWLLKLFSNNLLPLEDLYKANTYLTLYEKVKQAGKIPIEQRDINKIKSLSDLFAIVSPFEKEEIKSKTELEKEKKLEGADKIYEDAHWLVISPKTEQGACLYGKDTQWCTASSKGYNRFEYYHKQGPLYIMFDKTLDADPRKNPMKKLQFHFETKQFMDANDHQLKDIGAFFRKNKTLLDLFSRLGKATAPFKLEHRLMEPAEALGILKDPKRRLEFLDDKHGKFGASWVFDYLAELGETDEIRKIIFEDSAFLKKIIKNQEIEKIGYGFSRIFGPKTKYSDVPEADRAILAKFLYNNPVILNYLSEHNEQTITIEQYIKLMQDSGKLGKEYIKDMYLKTDTMYDIMKKQKDIVNYYNILQKNTFGREGVNDILAKLSNANTKYAKDYIKMFNPKSLKILQQFLNDVNKTSPKKALEETFSIGVFKEQFMKEGNEYLKNLGFSSETPS